MLSFSAREIVTNETKNISTAPWWLDAVFIKNSHSALQFLFGTFYLNTRDFCFISAFRLQTDQPSEKSFRG